MGLAKRIIPFSLLISEMLVILLKWQNDTINKVPMRLRF